MLQFLQYLYMMIDNSFDNIIYVYATYLGKYVYLVFYSNSM